MTDVRASLVRGARTLCLVLLAWLLPLMTIIAAGFLGALIFTGLDPLWKTRFAAGYLLTASAILVILINAAYQDGHPDREAPRILRYAGALAGLLLVPLAIIAGYAILLRVRQYGWTTDRVASVAVLTMAAWYAVGYAAAALLPGPWLKHMERWNFLAALLALAILLALFSPIADPVRIAVASQVSRLESGQIAPDKFDFAYLRWDGGRFGDAALKKLAADGIPGNGRNYVRRRAQAVLNDQSKIGNPVTPTDVTASVTVYPKGRVLPAYFGSHDWAKDKQAAILPWCLVYTSYECDAFFIDVAGDGKEELLFLTMGSSFDALFARSPDGSWHVVSSPTSLWNCGGVVAAMRQGKYTLVAPPAPPPTPWRGISVSGLTLDFPPLTPPAQCPN